MPDSRLSGFYKLSVAERIDALEEHGWLTRSQASTLRAGRQVLAARSADAMSENVLGVFGLPYSVVPNFRLNGVDRLVPMAVEEPSVVAALSKAAGLARASGGFQADCEKSLLAGQVHVVGMPDADQAAAALRDSRDALITAANSVHPRMVERGGGVLDLEIRQLALPGGAALLVLHVLVDTRDAMGANLVNSICEALAGEVAELTAGRVALRILSNLADSSLVRASVRYPLDALATGGFTAVQVRDAIVLANDIARVDPYRAATHNKGIMNGIDPLAIATGNDWRAIEASAHAYAARDGAYRALTDWRCSDEGDLLGNIVLPLKVGTVGGTLAANPAVELSLALAGITSAGELAQMMAAVGLAQNFAALRALATVGIQHGHMRQHARSLASAAGASGGEIETVADLLVGSGDVKAWKAAELVAARQAQDSMDGAATAASKVILFGEHAVVYDKHALAVALPGAVRALAVESTEGNSIRCPDWETTQGVNAKTETALSQMRQCIQQELGVGQRQFSITIRTRLPGGKGLGLSAAVAVAVTRAIADAAELEIDDERVNAIAFECEKLSHGTPSGVDNTIACFASPILYRRAGTPVLTPLELREPPPLVVAIGHQTGETRRMVDGVRQRREEVPQPFDDIFRQIDALAVAGAEQLQAADYDKLGASMNLCHGLLNALGVSTPELEFMVQLARDAGARGAKLTGAGGGGAIVALCPGRKNKVVEAFRAAGFDAFDCTDYRA